MDDKRTPMEAEVQELAQSCPCPPEKHYGTAARPRLQRSHAWFWITVGLAVIALCTVGVVAATLHLRLVRTEDTWHLTMNTPEETAPPQEEVRDLPVSPGEAYVPGTVGSDSVQLRRGANREDRLTPEAIYTQISPAVVCVRLTRYYGVSTVTGVVISADGYVLSATEGLSNVAEISLTFADGSACAARAVGEDRVTGICLLKAEAEDLTPATFAQSDELAVGDSAYCVCNPYGSQIPNVFYEGLVSVSQSLELGGGTYRVLQTSAQLQTPDYGCPILNGQGQVVGLTCPIGQWLSASQAPSLAVCAGDISRIVAAMEGAGERLWLGMEVEEIPESYRLFYGFPGTLWVSNLASGSTPDQALDPYDVITAVDGEQVSTLEDFERILAAHKVGDWVRLTIFRSGQWYTARLPVVSR